MSGPAGKMMRAKGSKYPPWAWPTRTQGLLDQLVIDERDAHHAAALSARGVRAIVTESIMGSREREVALARAVLEALS